MAAEPRIFVLAREGWGETLEHYERRTGREFQEDIYRDNAVEVAPGVHVAVLATGDMVPPDGKRVTTGARVAVWRDVSPAERLLEEALHLRMNGERAPGGNETWREWDRKAEAYLRGLVPETTSAEMEG